MNFANNFLNIYLFMINLAKIFENATNNFICDVIMTNPKCVKRIKNAANNFM